MATRKTTKTQVEKTISKAAEHAVKYIKQDIVNRFDGEMTTVNNNVMYVKDGTLFYHDYRGNEAYDVETFNNSDIIGAYREYIDTINEIENE